MNSNERKLQERIKELSCLYEISSIIGSVDAADIELTLMRIANSLKNAFQYPELIEVEIAVKKRKIATTPTSPTVAQISSNIKIFNESEGGVIVFFKNPEIANFLKEEQDLLDNVGFKIGNMMERIEIHESENSLRRQMERADRLVILGELTAGIAHELNTPLTNILGFAELVKSNLKADQASVNDMDKIIQNTIFSREVVKKLMFFACEMPQERKEVDLVSIINHATNLLDPTFRKNKVNYEIQVDKKSITLVADAIQLTQIIFNLCMNAIYFSPKGGTVIIGVSENEEKVFLSISDEGRGLSEENLEKVFQPFYTTKAVGEGSGLGLSVVHGIVKSHKGTITAENNPTKGACFKVELPK
jgi:signal transduction histidine kinase